MESEPSITGQEIAANPALQELEELWAKQQTSATSWSWNREELHRVVNPFAD